MVANVQNKPAAPKAAEAKASPAAPAIPAKPQEGRSLAADVQEMVRLVKRLGVSVASRIVEDVDCRRV